MALYFFGSSALVKRYVHERGSGWVRETTASVSGHPIHKMMRRNLDERWSGLYDPQEPVTSRRVAYVAQKLDLSIDEVHRRYEAMADRLQIGLNLEWRRSS
jgi:hypothetical protein